MVNIIQIEEENNINANNNFNNICNKLNSSFTFLTLLTIINYLTSKSICINYKLPHDCLIDETIYDKYNSLSYLFFYIYLLYYFNNLKHICNYNFFTKFMFFFITLISNLVFSFCSSIKELQSSIQFNNIHIIETKFILLYIFILGLPIVLIIINLFIKKPSFNEIFFRIIFLLWFIIWIKIFYNNNLNVHIHHIFFSFVICIWCFQKNIIIKIIFFISMGIFIQGFANYKYEGLITSSQLDNTNESDIIYKDKIIYKCDYELEFIDYICYEIC